MGKEVEETFHSKSNRLFRFGSRVRFDVFAEREQD